MTRFSGYDIQALPCCGRRYAVAAYTSMNYMSRAYWTDGYREQSLMPNDNGLRQCGCGNYFVLSEMVRMDHVEMTDLPRPATVPTRDLPEAIAQARTPAIERAARLDLWLALNDPYRARYRAHRDAENAKSAPDQCDDRGQGATARLRKWWGKLVGVQASRSVLNSGNSVAAASAEVRAKRPFTVPPFEPTPEQLDNMEKLLALLVSERMNILHALEIAELNRELGRFEEASRWLENPLPHLDGDCARIIRQLIDERETAPVRYS